MITVTPAARFGEMLRDWRGRKGLSQLMLAIEAGISQRHISFVESGRSAPSRELVLRLAETLDLPLRERNGLLDAAGFAPIYSQSQLGAPSLEPALHALKIMLAHQLVYPAVVVDLEWNVLMSNRAADRFMSSFLCARPGPPAPATPNPTSTPPSTATPGPTTRPNMVRLLFDPAGLRPYVANWNTAAPIMIRQVRAAAAANPRHAGLQTLLKEIQGAGNPLGEALPPDNEPRVPMFALDLLKDGLRLSLFSMISTFGSPYDVTLAELRIESFFPANQKTESLLRRWSAEDFGEHATP